MEFIESNDPGYDNWMGKFHNQMIVVRSQVKQVVCKNI